MIHNMYVNYDEEDPTYYPEENENQDTDSETSKNNEMEIEKSPVKATLPIKIIQFQFTVDWKKFLSFVELDVELFIK